MVGQYHHNKVANTLVFDPDSLYLPEDICRLLREYAFTFLNNRGVWIRRYDENAERMLQRVIKGHGARIRPASIEVAEGTF